MLLADSQIIEFHAMIDGQFNLMETHLAELEKIFTRKYETLSPSLKLKIAYALALGNCFLHSDIQKVRHYDTLSLKLSVDNQFDNMTVSIRFIRAYRCCFVGDLRGARGELEASLPYLKNLRVSTLTKLFLRTLQVNLVEMAGDFNNYRDQKQNLERVVEQDVISQSIIGPFINIWDIDSALAENDIDTAERISQIALQKSFAASEAHMRSQFLGYYALVLSYKQKKEEALAAIRESYRLRQHVGGNSYIFLNHQMLGAAFAQLGLPEKAQEHFTKALTFADKIGDTWQRCSIYAHRAWMQSEAGNVDSSVKKDVKQCLKYMRENDYYHFFTYMPHVMERVLQLALLFNMEPVFTRQFLAKKFNKGVNRKGETIPLLNIKLLSGLTLNSENDRQLHVQELTDYEQQLLNAIIVSPGLQISDTAVSLQLWPDKNQLKQRASLDTLVFRVRKKLNDLVQPAKSKDYLIIEHGHVKLINVRVDVLQFLEFCKEARFHEKKSELWQAQNNFFSAFSLWEDSGINKLNLGENVIFQEAVEQEFLNSSKIWASILFNHERINKATLVLETAFRHFPQDTELARQLYDLYARAGNFGKAQNVIRMYKVEHKKIAESSLEVEEALAAFWNNSLN